MGVGRASLGMDALKQQLDDFDNRVEGLLNAAPQVYATIKELHISKPVRRPGPVN